jgi:tetratricopeptide (TPR) repeat protein
MSSRNGYIAWVGAAVLTVSALTPGSALAERQDARRHYAKATAAFGLGKYDDAATEYEAAFEIKPEPALLYNAAQAYRLAGKSSRAAQLYRNYLRLYGDAQNADDARQHLAHLESLTVGPPPSGPRLRPSLPTADVPHAAHPSPPLARPSALAKSPPAPPDTAASPRLEIPATNTDTNTNADAEVRLAPRPSAPASTGAGLARRPVFWVAVAAVVLAGSAALVLSRSRDQDPRANLGTIVGN